MSDTFMTIADSTINSDHTYTSTDAIPMHLERLLFRVDKPARYLGGEFNTTLKAEADVDCRVALAFPDVYDIGMSYHGFKIFYERLNRMEGVQCERVFAPWPDFEALLREDSIPLYMLESKRALRDAHIIGFTLQHEMNYTNLLNMLDLGGVPVEASERTDADPVVVAGGHGAFNPEVLADFVDAFVIGDGEWALEQIIAAYRTAARGTNADDGNLSNDLPFRYRGDGSIAKRKAVPTFRNADVDAAGPWKNWQAGLGPRMDSPGSDSDRPNRQELLLKLAQIPGVYVPRFYRCEWNDDGTVARIVRTRDDVPETIQKINFDVRDDLGATQPVVPLLRVVHDRFAIEIKRGCMVGCRFCQAGMISRPLRERSPEQIVEIARAGIQNTGYDEISLLSLSSADYSGILELTRALRNAFAGENISVSLPSLRINAFDIDLADEIGSVRKSGFTFAPEAGSERLRQVINKAVDQSRFEHVIEEVLKRGWRTLKFYFMCGLPTETDEDLDGIVQLTETAIRFGRKYCGNNFQLNISLSPFIPKPHTPFQWHAQPTLEEFERKYQYVQSRINRKFVSLKKHSTRESIIEGVLGRGDRRTGRALKRAWELGCKFDNWSEHLRFDLWQQAFAETNFDPYFYASRERTESECLPWDHIQASLGKRFLWLEKTRSEAVKITTDCSTTKCAGCNVCDFKEVKNLLSVREDGEFFAPPAAESTSNPQPVRQPTRLRMTYAKSGALRFVSHLDFVKLIQIILRRSGLLVSYSQGFNPQPKIQFAQALPMGFAASGDLVDIVFEQNYDPADALEAVRRIELDGLRWLDCEAVELKAATLGATIRYSHFSVSVSHEYLTVAERELLSDLNPVSIDSALRATISFETKRGALERNLSRSVANFSLENTPDDTVLKYSVNMGESDYVNPILVASHVLGFDVNVRARVTRTGFAFDRAADLAQLAS